jgi:hypothetical protein
VERSVDAAPQQRRGRRLLVRERDAREGIPFNEGDIDAAAVDFDNDGRIDLSVTRDKKYEGSYSKPDQKAWFGLMHQNVDGTFTSIGLASGINDRAGTTDRVKAGQNLAWADIDADGDLDLLVGGRDNGAPAARTISSRTRSATEWMDRRTPPRRRRPHQPRRDRGARHRDRRSDALGARGEVESRHVQLGRLARAALRSRRSGLSGRTGSGRHRGSLARTAKRRASTPARSA